MQEFKKVIFSVDCHNIEPDLKEKAIRTIAHLDCELVIVDNIRDLSWIARATLPDHEKVAALVVKEKQELLDQLVSEFQQAGVSAKGVVLHGPTSTAVLEFAEAENADLIFRVTKGKKSKEAGRLGRTSKRILRKCPCAVWLVHPQTKPASENIVVCIDTGSNEADELEFGDKLLKTAESLKQTGHGLVSIVHAWELWNEKMVAHRISKTEFQTWKETCKKTEVDAFEVFLERHSKSVNDMNVFVVEGDPSAAIAQFAKTVSADLVVIGTIGRSGLSGFLLGNTAERIFERVDCDVLALKP